MQPYGSPVIIATDVTGDREFHIIAGGLQISKGKDVLLKVMEDTIFYSYSEVIRTNRSQNIDDDPEQSKIGDFTSHGVVWQIGFEYNAADTSNWQYDESNPQIAALMKQVKQAKGLMMRFSTFECMPEFTAVELEKDMKPNPAYGYLIGTVGVWHEGEIRNSLPGRRLVTLTPDCNPDTNFKNTHGDTYVQLDKTTNVVSVDLVNTFPKEKFREAVKDLTTISPNIPLNGSLKLKYGNPEGHNGEATLLYDNAEYYKTGGIADVRIHDADAAVFSDSNLELILSKESSEQLWVKEQAYRIQSEQRGVYITPNDTAEVTLQISKRGQPLNASESLQILVQQDSSGFLGSKFAKDEYEPPSVDVKYGNQLIDQGGSIVKVSSSAEGQVEFQLDWKKATCSLISFWAGEEIPAMENFYLVNKTYADDNYDAVIAAGNIPWDTVYHEVLCYYAAIFPAMNSYNVFFDREENIVSLASIILERISSKYAPTTLFMPVTRTMSPGKRKLLKAFLEQELAKE